MDKVKVVKQEKRWLNEKIVVAYSCIRFSFFSILDKKSIAALEVSYYCSSILVMHK